MKKINNKIRLVIITIITLIVLFSIYLVGTGFVKRTDVSLFDYYVSADGTEMTFTAYPMSSVGYTRGFKEFPNQVQHYLTFYSTFGGINSSFGAEKVFTLELSSDSTEIYFWSVDKKYELMLIKDETTGQWCRPSEIKEEIKEEIPEIVMLDNPNWGITFEVDEISATGLYLLCTQSGGEPTGELHTGSRFVVEKLTEKYSWQEVEEMPQKYPRAWTDEAWGIPKDETIVWRIDWDILYGRLAAGKYRIGKEVTDFRDTGDYDNAMIYAEFEIKE